MRYCLVFMAAATFALAASDALVQFNRDIRPILSEHCFTCHGPDEGKRQGKLRLDVEAIAKSDLGGHFAIVPGNPLASELLHRVGSSDNARRMPPAYSGAARLSDREIGPADALDRARGGLAEVLVLHPTRSPRTARDQRPELAEKCHRLFRDGEAGSRGTEAIAPRQTNAPSCAACRLT
jgi:Planctomycete cytochrome C